MFYPRVLFFKIQTSFSLFCIYFGFVSFVMSRRFLCYVSLSLITQIASTSFSSASDHPVSCVSATAAKLTSANYGKHKIPEDNGFPLVPYIK